MISQPLANTALHCEYLLPGSLTQIRLVYFQTVSGIGVWTSSPSLLPICFSALTVHCYHTVHSDVSEEGSALCVLPFAQNYLTEWTC